ncbi:hypothetical protein [Mycobacterium avium]|uniref:hypothetical protein n=1 Tax=Mycobacterium avium TaxID=1764 RepID=UPI00111C2725|nr:hypothetical protein [Mycobacterium avium]
MPISPLTGSEVTLPSGTVDLRPRDGQFNGHTAIGAGNGQLLGFNRTPQPLGVINNMPGFAGFHRPPISTDAGSNRGQERTPCTR